MYGVLTRSRTRSANTALKRLPALAAAAYGGSDLRMSRNRTVTGPVTGNGGSIGTRYYVSKGRKSSGKGLKGSMLKIQQAKHVASSDLANLLHSSIFVKSLTTLITQGDGISNRDGDAIHLEALKYCFNIQTPTSANGYTYRFMLVLHDNEISANWASGGLAVADLFHSGTETNWTANALINSKAVTVLHDEIIDINSQISAVSDTYSTKGTIQINRKFLYKASASTYGKSVNLYGVLIGCTVGGTTGTTSTGTVVAAYDLIFKDL